MVRELGRRKKWERKWLIKVNGAKMVTGVVRGSRNIKERLNLGVPRMSD
jgi:hypothetical protein